MRKNGFTLVELLVTIAVAVILATVALPGFQRVVAVNRMASDYNEILSGLNYARSEAIKRRKDVAFDVTSTSPWAYQVTVDGNPIRVRSGRDSNTAFGDEGSDFVVTFGALGKRESCDSGCSLTLNSISSYAEARSLSVNIVGRVSGSSS